MNGLIRRGVVAAISVVAATGAIAGPASAGILTAPAKDCGDESLSQPFAQFGDKSQYKLVQGGSFESSLADWTLMGGAKVVSGNEPWKVGGSGHGKSLVLPAGSSVITPPACVGLEEPTLRFFAKKNSGCSALDAGGLGVREDVARAGRPGAGRCPARQRSVEGNAQDADRRQPAAAAPG